MTRPWLTVGAEPTPDGALELKRRGDKDFLITLQNRVVMTSAAHRSEDALAKLACAGLRARDRVRVLVSGLGMGFTLRAALAELGPAAQVVVAELNPVVAAWCQGPLAPLTDGAASDPRVALRIEDVSKTLRFVGERAGAARFDAIVLDMYEGPPGFVRANDPLYSVTAMVRARAALAPGGVLAVWCEARSPGFERSLSAATFEHELHRVGHGARVHYVYLARQGRGAEPELGEARARVGAAPAKRTPARAARSTERGAKPGSSGPRRSGR